jgi:hypothetical protein
MHFDYNLTICGPWGKEGTKFILLARKVPTLVATFSHKKILLLRAQQTRQQTVCLLYTTPPLFLSVAKALPK